MTINGLLALPNVQDLKVFNKKGNEEEMGYVK